MDPYRQYMQALVTGVVESEGDAARHLRRTMWLYAEALAGGGGSRQAPDAPLDRYAALVVHESHKITDRRVSDLLDAGYSDDAAFELTLAAALGAGTARLTRVLDIMRGV